MRFCRQCGADLHSQQFCSACGAPAAPTGQRAGSPVADPGGSSGKTSLPDSPASPPPPPPAPRPAQPPPQQTPWAGAPQGPAAGRRPKRRLYALAVGAIAAALAVVAVLLLNGRSGPVGPVSGLVSAAGSSSPADPGSPPVTGAPSASLPPVLTSARCTYRRSGGAARAVSAPSQTAALPASTLELTTSRGPVTVSLDVSGAPCASNALVSLAEQHYYDSTPCHRLTTEGIFVLQCGDPTGSGSGGPGYVYDEENLTGATYPRGTVAMAKTAAPGTTGSQFFLVYQDTDLPPQYTVVGRVTRGLDVLNTVAAGGALPAGDGAPTLPVQIQTAVIRH